MVVLHSATSRETVEAASHKRRTKRLTAGKGNWSRKRKGRSETQSTLLWMKVYMLYVQKQGNVEEGSKKETIRKEKQKTWIGKFEYGRKIILLFLFFFFLEVELYILLIVTIKMNLNTNLDIGTIWPRALVASIPYKVAGRYSFYGYHDCSWFSHFC